MSPSDENTPLFTKGEYRKPLPTDLRSPCPIINSLANHGYIPRDGRQVRAAELRAAISEIGVSSTIGSTLTYGAYLEHEETPPTGVWAFLGGPFAYMLQHFGLRDVNEVDSEGVPCLNLDQLARHGVIEHDVSLSRRDTAQGDNCSPQKDLIAGLIMSSSDGVVITNEDLARFRRQRLYQQKRENPDLLFTNVQNTMACAEAAFIQKIFGDSSKAYAIPVSYIRALFADERLPIEEGWKKRSWWYLGFVDLFRQAQVLQKAVGAVE